MAKFRSFTTFNWVVVAYVPSVVVCNKAGSFDLRCNSVTVTYVTGFAKTSHVHNPFYCTKL